MQHFRQSQDWKDKVKNCCECFIGGSNKLGLSKESKDKECLGCELYDLKKLFFSYSKPSSLKFTVCLMKLNVFNRKEIIAAIDELFPNLDAINIYRKVHHRISTDPQYYYFINSLGVVKVYEKDKI